MTGEFNQLEINGGRVECNAGWRLWLDPSTAGYADAQIDDYGGLRRSAYRWRPGTQLSLKARFSHEADRLVGTAGFGFWNAPFGDPTVRWPALPQATWFFFASEPSDLPFPETGPGRGWFAGTIAVSVASAIALAPVALPVMAANNIGALRPRIWPRIRRRLGISYAPVRQAMADWHHYNLVWGQDGCRFSVDDTLILDTAERPRGPMGFVCWIDNQFMVATPGGRLRWGTKNCPEAQWLEIKDLHLVQHATPF